MKYLPFAPLERQLSRLVLGTMVLSPERMDLTGALVETFLELGGNVVDTAHIYNGGNSERALGRWLGATGRRQELVILDKGAHHNADRRRVTPEDITTDLRDSLARLQVETIDLYLLHRDDPSVPVGPVVEALNEHRRAGRIRAFGGSNWSPARLDEANAYAAAHGLEGFCASSPHLSLARPNGTIWDGCLDACDPATQQWYARSGIPLFAWSSQARGFFSGRFAPDRRDDATIVRVYYSDANWERLRRATELGVRRGGYSPTQVALAWVLHQPFATFALVGPHSVDELRASVDALALELTPDEVGWLNLES
jgi:aryl-alcohol dehydrogenase-like predicted oxidoreductase